MNHSVYSVVAKMVVPEKYHNPLQGWKMVESKQYPTNKYYLVDDNLNKLEPLDLLFMEDCPGYTVLAKFGKLYDVEIVENPCLDVNMEGMIYETE